MKRRLEALFTLSSSDRGLLVQAWFLLLLVDWGLRLASFRSVQSLLSRSSKSPKPDDAMAEVTLQRTSQIVDIAGKHHLYPMTCLRSALVLQYLVACQGVETDLRFGVRKIDDQLDAHAWLEFGGQPILEQNGTYYRFSSLREHRANQYDELSAPGK